MLNSPKSAGAAFLLLFMAAAAADARADVPLLEPDVLPILTKRCMGCHGGLKQEGGLDLRTVPSMLHGGDSGRAIESGNSVGSMLWKRIASDEMPEGRDKLSAVEKAMIREWIDAKLPTLAAQQQNVDARLTITKRHAPGEVARAIDQHINSFLAQRKLTPVGFSDDVEFLRRIYLDLTGRIPTAEQATEFLDNQQANKRAQLVDTLVASPAFGEHFGRTWRDWISPAELPSDMNGGKQPHREAQNFGQWLGEKFAAGEPWDKIVRDILTVEGQTKEKPQVIFFGLVGQDGKTTPDGSARAVASLFMGVQLQCAQCHDDPYRDWSQESHWALAAFFGNCQGDFKNIESGKGPSKKPGEIVIPAAAFKNSGTVVSAAFLSGDSLGAKRSGDLRNSLVDWLTAKDNPYFSQSFINRLWFQMFLRGIVNPVDDFRELNPPSHPGLLKLLAGEFAASDYDIKHLVRCICNSQAYQRTSRGAADDNEQQRAATTTAFGQMPLRVMTADMLYESLKLAYDDAKLDLRPVGAKESNTAGESAPVGDAYLEFQRLFRTSEENPTEITYGIPQMLTLLNHPRLLDKPKALNKYLTAAPQPEPSQVIERLYLSTLSRRPTAEEAADAASYVAASSDSAAAYVGVLWTLVNRSEFLLVR